MEPRAGTKGNVDRQSTLRAQDRAGVSQALGRIRKAARQSKTEKFTTLLHHVDVRLLRESYLSLRRDASPGVDGITWEDYGLDLESRLMDLHERVHRGAYRAQPSRRVMIPKGDGKQRPLAIAALEDKIVQKAATSGSFGPRPFPGTRIRDSGQTCTPAGSAGAAAQLRLRGRVHRFFLALLPPAGGAGASQSCPN